MKPYYQDEWVKDIKMPQYVIDAFQRWWDWEISQPGPRPISQLGIFGLVLRAFKAGWRQGKRNRGNG